MVNLLIPLILTFILSIFHYFFESYVKHFKKYDVSFTSFSSGLFITYIFISLFPEVVKGSVHHADRIYLYMLLGFVFLHVIEKYVSRHALTKYKRARDLREIRTATFIINLFVIGAAMITFAKIGDTSLLFLTFIPALFHVVSSSLLVEHLHKSVREHNFFKILCSGAIFFGAVAGFFFVFSLAVYYFLIAFMAGTLLYLITRDVLPKYRLSNSFLFILGIITYILIVEISKYLFIIY